MESAIRVHEEEHGARRMAHTKIPCARNALMGLPQAQEGKGRVPLQDLFRGGFGATVVHYNHFKFWRSYLSGQRSQATIQQLPVVVYSDHNADFRHWRDCGTVF